MAPKRKSAATDAEKSSGKRSKPESEAEEKPSEAAGAKRKAGGAKTSKKESSEKAKKASASSPQAKSASKSAPKRGKKDETGQKEKKSEPAKGTTGPESPDKDVHKVEPVSNPKDVPEGIKRDKRGRLVFQDFPDFRPTLTPKQVIQAGSFGGIYFNPMGGRKGILFPKGVPISADDFPKDWFEGLRDEQYKGRRYNIQLNRYKVKSGQNQQQWEEQGWIKKDSPDKRGWFHWYCNFTLGRRCDDDKRQISRWTGVAGPKGRWKTRLVNLVKNGSGDVNDGSISPVIRQNLLHWAYELTKEDYEAMIKGQR